MNYMWKAVTAHGRRAACCAALVLAAVATMSAAPAAVAAQACGPRGCADVTPPIISHFSRFEGGELVVEVYVADNGGGLRNPPVYTNLDTLWVNGVKKDIGHGQYGVTSMDSAYLAGTTREPAVVGTTTVKYFSCDIHTNCAYKEDYFTYHGPPSVNTIDVSMNNQDYVPAPHGTGTFSFATPAYVSLDQPRSVGLYYSSDAVAPRAVVRVGVKTGGPTIPTNCTVWLVKADGARAGLLGGGTEVTVPCGFHAADAILEVDASTLATGAYSYTAVLRRNWPDGTTSEVTAPVRVLIVNDRWSRIGAGWNLAGVQHMHMLPAGLLIKNGDGSASYFTAASNGYYGGPAGDFTRLIFDGAQYRRTYPDGSVVAFDQVGRISYQEDRFGNRTTYTWTNNVEGVPVISAITDPVGKVTQLAYATAYPHTGKLASITDPAGRATGFGYWDGWGNLTAIQTADGAGVALGYDAPANRLTSSTDPSGARTDYTYDARRRLASVAGPAVTLADGRSVRPTVAYTVTATSLKASDARSTIYEATGRDAYGNFGNTKQADGSGSTHSYDELGRLLQATESVPGRANASSVTYHYGPWTVDITGLPRAVQHGGGPWTVYHRRGWADHFVVDSISTNPDPETSWGATTVQRFYYSGSPLKMDSTRTRLPDNTWRTTRTTYDARGRLVSTTDQQGHASSVTYQTTGMQNTASATAELLTTWFTYDAAGRVTGTTDSAYRTTGATYDVVNRVLTQTGPAGTVQYGYNVAARTTTVTDPKGQSYTSRYNAMGWPVSIQDPRGGRDTLGYDERGRVVMTMNRRGQVLQTTYDDLDRPLTLVGPDVSISYAYDPLHRWTAVQNAASIDTLFTDDRGRPSREVAVRGGQRHVVNYRYPTYPDSVTRLEVGIAGRTPWSTAYTVSKSGHLSSISAFGEAPTRFTYDSEGKLTREMHTSTNFQADRTYTGHRLNTFTTNTTPTNVHAQTWYGYDIIGRISPAQFTHFRNSRHIIYDAADRISYYWDENLNGPVRHDTYTYDAVGNRTDRGGVTQTGNLLTQFAGYNMTYDADGNTTSKGNGVDNRTFTWNSLGQLTGVTLSNGKQVQYAYDGMGRRVRRVTNGVETRYVYANGHLAAELNGAGTVLREFAYYPGVDRPYAMRADGLLKKYVLDGENNVTAVLDHGNNPAYSYKYDPWGNFWYTHGDLSLQPLQYRAREYDLDTGLLQNRARWYDPQLGRFLSEDPIGLAGGINPFAYAGNDPVNRSDPSGLSPECDVDNWYVCLGWVSPFNGCTVTQAASVNCPMLFNHVRSGDSYAGQWLADQAVRKRSIGSWPTSSGSGSVTNGSFGWDDLRRGAVETGGRVLSALYTCKYDAAGLVIGAIAGGAAKKFASAANDVRQTGQQLYQLGHHSMGTVKDPKMVAQGLRLLGKANLYDTAVFALEATQIGGIMFGLADLGGCLYDNY
jgi:RHS repeat-associated protein